MTMLLGLVGLTATASSDSLRWRWLTSTLAGVVAALAGPGGVSAARVSAVAKAVIRHSSRRMATPSPLHSRGPRRPPLRGAKPSSVKRSETPWPAAAFAEIPGHLHDRLAVSVTRRIAPGSKPSSNVGASRVERHRKAFVAAQDAGAPAYGAVLDPWLGQ